MTFNKLINPAIPLALKVCMRAGFGLLFFSLFAWRKGDIVWQVKKVRVHILRIFLITLAMSCTYFTYTNLPFPIAITVGFTGPVFTAVLAFFLLKDHLKWGQWLAIFLGYLGVLVMLKPQGAVNYALYVAILGNIATGLSQISTKRLTQMDAMPTIILWGNVGIMTTTLLWTVGWYFLSLYGDAIGLVDLRWTWPESKDVQYLFVMGLFGVVAQYFYLKALQYASPGFLSSFEYSRLVVAIPIGLLLGEALPSWREVVGMGIIISSTVYNSWQSSVKNYTAS